VDLKQVKMRAAAAPFWRKYFATAHRDDTYYGVFFYFCAFFVHPNALECVSKELPQWHFLKNVSDYVKKPIDC
jgi:hypothetical protein